MALLGDLGKSRRRGLRCLPSKQDSFSASLLEWIFEQSGIGRY
jgi:hypothetical protein